MRDGRVGEYDWCRCSGCSLKTVNDQPGSMALLVTQRQNRIDATGSLGWDQAGKA